jgi:hypothetical protein
METAHPVPRGLRVKKVLSGRTWLRPSFISPGPSKEQFGETGKWDSVKGGLSNSYARALDFVSSRGGVGLSLRAGNKENAYKINACPTVKSKKKEASQLRRDRHACFTQHGLQLALNTQLR